MITRVCSYCKKKLGEIDCEETGVSHGICQACNAVVLAEFEAGRDTDPEKIRELARCVPACQRGLSRDIK